MKLSTSSLGRAPPALLSRCRCARTRFIGERAGPPPDLAEAYTWTIDTETEPPNKGICGRDAWPGRGGREGRLKGMNNEHYFDLEKTLTSNIWQQIVYHRCAFPEKGSPSIQGFANVALDRTRSPAGMTKTSYLGEH